MTLDEIAETSADPEAARARLARLLEVHPNAANMPNLPLLGGLLAGSEYLTGWLASRHGELGWLLEEGILDAPRSAEAMGKNLAGLMAEYPIVKALRYFKHRELCRICARELSGAASLEETIAEWTQAAELAIHAAAVWAMSEAVKAHGEPIYTGLDDSTPRRASFAVLGMGKLGGEELNISSDVDLIYVHTSDRGSTAGPEKIQLHEFFARVARSVTRALNEVTEDGFVFRVDLELRPEGGAGEVTNSIGAMETYYESYGRQWERQALLKARYCGGDRETAEEVIRRLQPFVYRKYMDEAALREISDIKNKIDLHQAAKKTAKSAADDIKLGRGGIREIEFTVQALQLLYGGRNKTLRVRPTMKALDACQAMGLISMPHRADLKDAYIYLRRMENRIQYDQNLQTQVIPSSPEKRAALARLMGYTGENPAERMMEEVGRKRKRVREIFDLFTLQKETEAGAFPAPLEDVEAISRWLDSLRFDHPAATARALLELRNGRDFSHPSEKSQRAFDRFGPELVAMAGATSWPDQAILGFANFVEAKKGRDQLYDMLEKHRPLIELLAKIFSASESLTASLLRQPDILDRLIAADPVGIPPQREKYAGEFSRILRGGARERRLELTNSFRIAETIRLGLRKILGLSGPSELMEALTMLAEEYLTAIVALAQEELPPIPEGTEWAFMAAGKLGRREMNFGSDLDLIAFYHRRGHEAGDEASADWVAQLTQKVIKLCGAITAYGYGYQVDMRLRPEGESSPLAPSANAAEEYYRSRAGAWERLALVNARRAAGSRALGDKMESVLRRFVESPLPGDAARIMAVRERMAKEKVKKGTVDIKFGLGGVVDIEFVCQWLSIENRFLPSGAVPFTSAILAEAKRRKWLEPEHAAKLTKGYELLRAVEDAIRMNREQALHAIPESDVGLIRRLARSVEMEAGPEKFLERLRSAMAEVNGEFIRFFAQRPGG